MNFFVRTCVVIVSYAVGSAIVFIYGAVELIRAAPSIKCNLSTAPALREIQLSLRSAVFRLIFVDDNSHLAASMIKLVIKVEIMPLIRGGQYDYSVRYDDVGSVRIR